MQPQVLGAAEVVVEHAVLEDDADRAPDLDGVGAHVVAADRRLPARRPDQRGEHADRGGLARAVGSEQAEDLPGPDPEREAPDGMHRAGIGLGELGDDHRVCSWRRAWSGTVPTVLAKNK